jgi:hypothetical protein
MAVLAVGGDKAVARLEHWNDSGGDRFFAVIEVEKAADLLLRVEFGAFLLEAADADHVTQEIKHVLSREPGLQ